MSQVSTTIEELGSTARQIAIAAEQVAEASRQTLENLSEGPVAYGGTRNIFCRRRDMEGQSFASMDSPFSFALDTALLPVTGIFEILRWFSGARRGTPLPVYWVLRTGFSLRSRTRASSPTGSCG